VCRKACRCPISISDGFFGSFRKQRQLLSPVARLVEDCTDLIATIAELIKSPMLKLNAGSGFILGDKANLNFRP
jgi:hypothetical protein